MQNKNNIPIRFNSIQDIILSLGEEYLLKNIRFKYNMWEVALNRKGKYKYIGCYKTKEKAIKAKLDFLCNEFLENIREIGCSVEDIYKTKFDGYFVTTNGDIINRYGKKLVGFIDKCGYKEITLTVNNKTKTVLVHRLELESISPIDNSEMYDVNHKDGNKQNNRIENLEWVTRAENIRHSYKNDLQKTVRNQYGVYKVINSEVITQIKKLIDKYTVKDIASQLGYNVKTIRKYIKRIKEGYYD